MISMAKGRWSIIPAQREKMAWFNYPYLHSLLFDDMQYVPKENDKILLWNVDFDDDLFWYMCGFMGISLFRSITAVNDNIKHNYYGLNMDGQPQFQFIEDDGNYDEYTFIMGYEKDMQEIYKRFQDNDKIKILIVKKKGLITNYRLEDYLPKGFNDYEIVDMLSPLVNGKRKYKRLLIRKRNSQIFGF